MSVEEEIRSLLTHENFTTVFLSVVLGFSVLWHFFTNRNLPPGPYGIPYFGYLPFLGEHPHLTLARLAKSYGDVFSFTVLGKTHIHLNSLSAIKEAFVEKADDFSGREPGFSILSWVDDGKGISATEGREWKEQRQFFFQSVRKFGFGKLDIENHIHEAVNKLLETVRNSKGKPLDLNVPLSNSACDVICKIIMYTELGEEAGDFDEIARRMRHISLQFSGPRAFLVGPIAKLFFFYLPSGRVLQDCKVMIHNIVRKITTQHKETFDKNHIRDFMDCYLEELQKLDQNVNLLIEGSASISSTVYEMLRVLLKHPEVQVKIQKELDDVVGSERLPSWIDKSNLPFTEATLYELHRVAIPFPLAALHSNPRESNLRGYRIPKRSLIISNLWSVHMDPKLYPEPEKFNPHRFLNAEGKFERGQGLYHFGIGRRSCIGEPLAVMELFLFMTSLLQKFTLKDPGCNDDNATNFELIAVPRGH